MSVYMVIEAKVHDQEKFDQYLAAFSEIMTEFGGRYVVCGGRVIPLDDDMKPERRQPEQYVILAFPSEVSMRRCFASPAHQAILPLRQAGAQTRAVLLEGFC